MKFSLIERSFVVAVAFGLGMGIGMSSVGIVSAARALASKTCNGTKACAQYTNGGSGPGIQGNNSGSGGANAFGVLGISSGTDGVHGTSTHAGSSGVAGIMTGSSSSNGNGVYGQSSDSSGKYAALYAAGYNSGTYLFQGFNFSTNDDCKIDPKANLSCTGSLAGNSASSNGVTGNSSASLDSGVAGQFVGKAYVTGNGVYGASSYGDGVYGFVKNGDSVGVLGEDAYPEYSSVGVLGKSDYMGTALEAQTDAGNIFYGYSYCCNCAIDYLADLSCTGSITGDRELRARLTTTTRRHVLSYASESATPTIEDLGAARLRDGIADVEIPEDFASVMDRSSSYYVFLTPMADTRGLYVSRQDPSRFQVRENMHGRSNVTFQYRIIAVPLGAKNVRLPAAPEAKLPPRPKLPAHAN